jgi:hypothetical protein
MTKKLGRKIISGLFLFIFFLKMVISTVPLLVKYSDSEHIIAVILQLEIENNTKETDHSKGKGGKEFCFDTHSALTFSTPLYNFLSKAISVEKHGHIQSFYPSVPTPPPNA